LRKGIWIIGPLRPLIGVQGGEGHAVYPLVVRSLIDPGVKKVQKIIIRSLTSIGGGGGGRHKFL
jgi:hypothetical protein